MNSVIINPDSHLGSSQYVIDVPYRIKHIVDHLHLKVGDQFKATLLNQSMAIATLREIQKDRLLVDVESIKPVRQKNINLLVGISRPPTMKKILEHATSMGVTHFTIIPALLSEKSYFTSKIYNQDQIDSLLSLGIEQSALYYKMPSVTLSPHLTTKITTKEKILLHPDVSEKWFDLDVTNIDDITLAIGPERGWTKSEVDLLVSEGFKLMSMGSSRLRTEIATFAALSHLL